MTLDRRVLHVCESDPALSYHTDMDLSCVHVHRDGECFASIPFAAAGCKIERMPPASFLARLAEHHPPIQRAGVAPGAPAS